MPLFIRTCIYLSMMGWQYAAHALDAELEQYAARLTPTDSVPIIVFSDRRQALLKMRHAIPAWFSEGGVVHVPITELQAITWHDWQGGDAAGSLVFNPDGTAAAAFEGMAATTRFGQFSVIHNNQTGWVLHGELGLDGFGVIPHADRINDSVMLGYTPGSSVTQEFLPELRPQEWQSVMIFSSSGSAMAKFAAPSHFWFNETDWGVPLTLDENSTVLWFSFIHPGKLHGHVTREESGSALVYFSGMPLDADEGNIMLLQEDGSAGLALAGNFSTYGVEGAVARPAGTDSLGYTGTSLEQPGLAQLPLREDFEGVGHRWRREDVFGSARMAVVECGSGQGHCLQVSNTPQAADAQGRHVQIKRTGFTDLIDGTLYRGSIRLRAERPVSIPLWLGRDVPEWDSFGLKQSCNANSEWRICEFEFIAQNHPERTPAEIRFALAVGHIGATVWIDDIQLYAAADRAELQNYRMVMNWAESLLPDVFPLSGKQRLQIYPFLARYYPQNNAYLGYNPTNNRFYAYNPLFWGEEIVSFGLLEKYLPNAKADIVEIAALGDSITEAEPEESYALRLERMLGSGYYFLQWHNTPGHGVSGATALKNSHLSIWDTEAYADLLTTTPDIVMILLGTNDVLDLVAPELFANFEHDYRQLVQSVQNLPSQPRVVLVYPPPLYAASPEGDEKIRTTVIPALDRIAAEYNLQVVDLYHAATGYPANYPDNLHPAAAANQAIAEVLHTAILERTTNE